MFESTNQSVIQTELLSEISQFDTNNIFLILCSLCNLSDQHDFRSLKMQYIIHKLTDYTVSSFFYTYDLIWDDRMLTFEPQTDLLLYSIFLEVNSAVDASDTSETFPAEVSPIQIRIFIQNAFMKPE